MLGIDRKLALVGFAAAIVVGGAGAAVAGVSDGNYTPADQNCTGHADDASAPDRAEPGCHTFTVYAGDQSGGEAARVGFQQTPDGEFVDPTQPQVTTADPAAGDVDPTTGLRVYVGADDNLNGGEHDGSDYIGNGPSDGGAIQFNVDPAAVDAWIAAVSAGDVAFLLTHPLPGVDFGIGACADGVCFAVQTQERVAYQGEGDGERHVADYEGHEWDPPECAGPSDTEEDCRPEGAEDPPECADPNNTEVECPEGIQRWHQQYGTTYVEPGVQVYEDPDPAGSPLGPYPIPAAYVGTCGVIVGGGDVQAPASDYTNSAGQVRVGTGCNGELNEPPAPPTIPSIEPI